MNILKALIIDDEPLAHKVILQYAKDLPFLKIVGQVYKATDAYALLQTGGVDLLFLDINMPTLKGLDFLRTLTDRPAVIVTSAYEEYALEGYELQVTDYLLKPFRFERFLQAVMKVKETKTTASVVANEEPAVEKIFVKVDKRQVQISVLDIIYVESYGNYVKVWLADKYLLTPRTLTSFEQELPSLFSRIHKSYIVQRACIDYVEGNQLKMSNGELLPIGKNHRTAVKGWFK
ncbi:MAG: LytTR family DNA-binding domain-containing protein [Bacteroidota bacterium]